MTPEQRAKRLAAAASELRPYMPTDEATARADGILAAADEAVPVVAMWRDGNGWVDPYAKLKVRDGEVEELLEEAERAEKRRIEEAHKAADDALLTFSLLLDELGLVGGVAAVEAASAALPVPAMLLPLAYDRSRKQPLIVDGPLAHRVVGDE